jgi:hypothetical protein
MVDLEYVSKLLQALLLAVLPVLAAQGSALLFAAYKNKRAQLNAQNQYMLDTAIRVAVFAAEQIYKGGNGEAKKAYAFDIAEKWLAQHNLNIDLDVLDAQIEAAVKTELNNQFPALPDGA